MRQLVTLVALGAMALAPSFARADQCAWVPQATADDAIELLQVGDEIVFFCEPCGDSRPALTTIESLTSVATGVASLWEVSVNGQGIDMAYTFIANGDGNWVNLSKMVDCESSGVSCMLDENLAVLASSTGICAGSGPDSSDDGDKFDELAGAEAGGCSVGGRGGAGGPAMILLGLAAMLLARRRRA